MVYEIVSTNLGGSSNISGANGWAMKQIYQYPIFRIKIDSNKKAIKNTIQPLKSWIFMQLCIYNL